VNHELVNHELGPLVLAHFRQPRRVGRWDPGLPEVGTGWAGNPHRGEVLRLQIRVLAGKIDDTRFKAFGSVWTIAVGSHLADTLVGKTLEGALAVTDGEVMAMLQLPPLQVRAAVLGVTTCRAAVADFRNKNSQTLSKTR